MLASDLSKSNVTGSLKSLDLSGKHLAYVGRLQKSDTTFDDAYENTYRIQALANALCVNTSLTKLDRTLVGNRGFGTREGRVAVDGQRFFSPPIGKSKNPHPKNKIMNTITTVLALVATLAAANINTCGEIKDVYSSEHCCGEGKATQSLTVPLAPDPFHRWNDTVFGEIEAEPLTPDAVTIKSDDQDFMGKCFLQYLYRLPTQAEREMYKDYDSNELEWKIVTEVNDHEFLKSRGITFGTEADPPDLAGQMYMVIGLTGLAHLTAYKLAERGAYICGGSRTHDMFLGEKLRNLGNRIDEGALPIGAHPRNKPGGEVYFTPEVYERIHFHTMDLRNATMIDELFDKCEGIAETYGLTYKGLFTGAKPGLEWSAVNADSSIDVKTDYALTGPEVGGRLAHYDSLYSPNSLNVGLVGYEMLVTKLKSKIDADENWKQPIFLIGSSWAYNPEFGGHFYRWSQVATVNIATQLAAAGFPVTWATELYVPTTIAWENIWQSFFYPSRRDTLYTVWKSKWPVVDGVVKGPSDGQGDFELLSCEEQKGKLYGGDFPKCMNSTMEYFDDAMKNFREILGGAYGQTHPDVTSPAVIAYLMADKMVYGTRESGPVQHMIHHSNGQYMQLPNSRGDPTANYFKSEAIVNDNTVSYYGDYLKMFSNVAKLVPYTRAEQKCF